MSSPGLTGRSSNRWIAMESPASKLVVTGCSAFAEHDMHAINLFSNVCLPMKTRIATMMRLCLIVAATMLAAGTAMSRPSSIRAPRSLRRSSGGGFCGRAARCRMLHGASGFDRRRRAARSAYACGALDRVFQFRARLWRQGDFPPTPISIAAAIIPRSALLPPT